MKLIEGSAEFQTQMASVRQKLVAQQNRFQFECEEEMDEIQRQTNAIEEIENRNYQVDIDLTKFSEIFAQFDRENARPMGSGPAFVPYYFPENGLLESDLEGSLGLQSCADD